MRPRLLSREIRLSTRTSSPAGSSRVQPGRWTNRLDVGDCIYARGRLGQGGILEVENAWVSIVNLSGTMVAGTAQSLTIDLGRDDLSPIGIGVATGAVMADGRSASTGIPS